MAFFLGIDGGGTKTRCLAGDDETTLGAGSSSGSKVQEQGEACARDALAGAIHEACVTAGISPRQITRTCAGISGAARGEIAERTIELIASVVGGEIEVVGDVEIAFEDAFGSGPGVLVIAGTGSIAYGRASDGRWARAGGWGHAVSDAGSGYWIGREAIRKALADADRGERTSLLEPIRVALGAENFDELIVRLNHHPAPDFAALFPVVLEAANSGDRAAEEILARAGCELAALARDVIGRLFPASAVSVALHGGVLESSPTVVEAFKEHLRRSFSRAGIRRDAVDAARGALKRARRNP